MVFFLGKVLALLTQPLVWVATLLALALVVLGYRPLWGRRLVGLALAVLLAMGWQPLPHFGLQLLERQTAELPVDADLSGYVGVIVLGGGLDAGWIAQAHPQPALNGAAERMTMTVALLRRNPQLRVVFTGGEGTLVGGGPSEAERARVFFDSLGVPASQVAYESQSRTTYENAILTAQMPGIDKTQRWLLLTSAWHMPRSMGTFAKAGWNVTAYPVDYRTGSAPQWLEYGLRDGADRWQTLLHEVIGSISYRMAGRI